MACSRWPLVVRPNRCLETGARPDAPEEKTGWLKDISFAGAQLSLAESLHLNNKLDMDVEIPENSPPMHCQAKVIWQRASAENNSSRPFVCGLSFTKFKDSDKERIFKYIHLFASASLKSRQ